jgi:hypothetical protein
MDIFDTFDTPPYGTVCFRDLELQRDKTLVVSGLSNTRMEVLLDLLHPLKLSSPQMQQDPFPHPEKLGKKASSKRFWASKFSC